MAVTEWKNPTAYKDPYSGTIFSNSSNLFAEDGNFAVSGSTYGNAGISNITMNIPGTPGDDYDTDYSKTDQQSFTLGLSNEWHTVGGSDWTAGMELPVSHINGESFWLAWYGLGSANDTFDYGAAVGGFGFEIPSGASVDGVEVKFKGYYGIGTPFVYHYLDNIQMRVYYTEAAGKNNIILGIING